MKLTRLFMIPFIASVLALGVPAGEAEAKRLGGGKSIGMSRDSQVMNRQATPPSQAAAPAAAGATAAAPAAATAAQKGGMSRWLGPIAGIAAGIGLAALLSHFGLGEGFASMLMLLLIGVAIFFVVRMLMRKTRPVEQAPLAYAGSTGASGANPGLAQPAHFTPAMPPAGGASLVPAFNAASETLYGIPAGFDVEGFIRQAKLNFLRLQAANDRGDMEDLRQFLAPELFAEVRMQYDERGGKTQTTDVQALEAVLLDLTTEGGRYIASVRFTGRLVEDGGPAETLNEVWHLTKPADGSSGWVVAGIQQAQ